MNIDLYFKQRQKAQSDIYIRHVQGLMEGKQKEREAQAKIRQERLIEKGWLLEDDLESAPQHPKIPLELELSEQQLIFEDINDIKNLDNDVTLSNKEKRELRTQFKELKFRKLLEIREKRVNEELSSGRSKYGSKLDIHTLGPDDAEEVRDKAGKLSQSEINEINDATQEVPQSSNAKQSVQASQPSNSSPRQDNILTNESLCKLLKKRDSEQQQMEPRNGYEMSVQKLSKVHSIEQDSIYSSIHCAKNTSIAAPVTP